MSVRNEIKKRTFELIGTSTAHGLPKIIRSKSQFNLIINNNSSSSNHHHP